MSSPSAEDGAAHFHRDIAVRVALHRGRPACDFDEVSVLGHSAFRDFWGPASARSFHLRQRSGDSCDGGAMAAAIFDPHGGCSSRSTC
jgi:hypothetical protein